MVAPLRLRAFSLGTLAGAFSSGVLEEPQDDRMQAACSLDPWPPAVTFV
jgi:hypothetical protein